ncbi:glycosyltransferase (plasmid) [Pseudanabaena biceps]|nr:glycosyltransferase [Pseudanabaena biceps]
MNISPKLSVIIPSFNSLSVLEQCLTALVPQIQDGQVEVLVIRGLSKQSDEYQILQKQFDQMQWISATEGETVPKMRLLGITHSKGEIIALLEDDCIVCSNWCSSIIKAHQSYDGVIGGAVEPSAYLKSLDWGVYLCEYARFMLPFEGIVQVLSGNNVSYKRTTLNQLMEKNPCNEGFYEVFTHLALQQSGQCLKADSSLIVHNCNSWKFTNISTVPFHHGRGFAGMRFVNQPLKRILFTGLTLVLPFIQMSRIIKLVLIRKRYVFELIKAAPYILIFFISWTSGEFVGYLFGAGKSLERWQ